MDIPPPQDLDEYSGAPLLPSAIAMGGLAIIAVVLRFVSRRITRVPLLWDDWLILAALPFSLLECVIDIEGNYQNHFGLHIETATPEQIRMFFITTYIFQLSYGFAVTLPKFSMLALYRRVFGLENFRKPLLLTFGACVAYLTGISFAGIFVCVPINAFWDRTIPGRCLPLLPFYIGQASVNIALDLVLLLVPIIPIRRLNITSSQKIAVTGIFMLGIFVTICSAIRLHALVETTAIPAAAEDPTYTFVGAAVWSVVETNLSVVCACLPSMRPLLRAMVHGKFRSSAGHSGYGSQLESGNRASGLLPPMSNKRVPSDRPAAPVRTWSERVATVERPNIQPRTKSSPADRARQWSRTNTSHAGTPDLSSPTEKYQMGPISSADRYGKKPSLTSWRPSCSRAVRAMDAFAGPSHSRDRSHDDPRSSWQPLHPHGRPHSVAREEDLEYKYPERRDSIRVQSSHIGRGSPPAATGAGAYGYRYEISGGNGPQEGRGSRRDRRWDGAELELETDSSDADVKQVELQRPTEARRAGDSRRGSDGYTDWERAKRKGKSLGRQVWDEWSRRPSRNE